HIGGSASTDDGLSTITSIKSPVATSPTAFLVISCGLGQESPRQSTRLASVTRCPLLNVASPPAGAASAFFFDPNSPIPVAPRSMQIRAGTEDPGLALRPTVR